MTWYLPQLEKAVYDRLAADTGTGGLFNVSSPLVTACYNGEVKAEQAYPFLSLNVVSAPSQDSMDTRVRLVTMDVHVYCKKSQDPGDSSYDGMDVGGKIIERVVGDWDQQSSRSPTFGLDRWKPTLTSWVADNFRSIEERADHEDGVYHWVLTFEVYVSRRV